MISDILDEAELKMDAAVEYAKEEFSAIRTGRAHPAMFNKITADYYGAPTPLQQLATFTSPDPRSMVITPFDRSAIGAIEKAIQKSDLGLMPANDGKLIRLPIPPLTEERRKELVKIAHQYAESARVAVRHVRRDGMEHAKKAEKDGVISQDESRIQSERVQKMTDEKISRIDSMLVEKEAEIMQV